MCACARISINKKAKQEHCIEGIINEVSGPDFSDKDFLQCGLNEDNVLSLNPLNLVFNSQDAFRVPID